MTLQSHRGRRRSNRVSSLANPIGWLDRVELCGEIQRYRRLKKQGLDAHRAAAIEAIVRDGEGMPPKALADGAVAGAADRDRMAEEKEAATEIEARLDRNGFDAIDINTEVFVQR